MSGEIGYVGLGSMGGRMVRRLLQNGFKLRVFDNNRDAMNASVAQGATAAASILDLANTVETVLVSLPTPDIVRGVAEELAKGTAIRQYIDFSTTGTIVAQEVAALLASNGIATLDAPVSGGPPGAESGNLAIMAAGNRDLYDKLQNILTVLGNRNAYVGSAVGQGQVAKLVNNLLVSTNYVAACEAVIFGVKAGLDATTLVGLINRSSGVSFSSETLLAKHGIPRTFDYGFRLELMVKDINLALQDARKLGIPMFTINAAAQLWSHAYAHLDPASDYTNLLRVVENWSGITTEGKPPAEDEA